MQGIPVSVLIDSYKASHPSLLPPAKARYAYGEFRYSFDNDPADHRILIFGLHYLVKTYISRRWTMEDIEKGTEFFSTHNVAFTTYPFPRELLERIVREHNGWFPIRIKGLPEGSVVYPHTPVYIIEAEEEFSALITWFETVLTMLWYPTTVATLSRRIRDLIEDAFEHSVAPQGHGLIESRLHDFGFRGCTSVEQAMIGGAAHLLSFRGTDTAVAAYYAQYGRNQGIPVAQSIPATEHSLMMAFPDERVAIMETIKLYGHGVFACVMDSYDYMAALEKVLPAVAQHKLERNRGFMVLRPDSGDPVEAVLAALRACEQVFGSIPNPKGYRVLCGCGVIQGDGINYQTIRLLLKATMEEGFSAENVAFGMGGGLLQRIHRDTMNFATKVSSFLDQEGVEHNVCKIPKGDPSKHSLPGRLGVRRDSQGVTRVFPLESVPPDLEEMMALYYDHGPVEADHLGRTFDQIRETADCNWRCLPKTGDSVSAELKLKMQHVRKERSITN